MHLSTRLWAEVRAYGESWEGPISMDVAAWLRFPTRSEVGSNEWAQDHAGWLHGIRSFSGRPCLALDLVEEFRPVIVDSVVLTLLNKRMLRLADFVVDTLGVSAEPMNGAKSSLRNLRSDESARGDPSALRL